MKIYILTDLEGITNIPDISYIIGCTPEQNDYACRQLEADVNAAISGAFDGGATEVAVLDGHGRGRNIIPENLDSRAILDYRTNGRYCGLLDETYSATLAIGMHAMAGTQNAFLDHTYSSATWYNYKLNGKKTGELGIWATASGHYGVPIAMVSGDEAVLREARDFFGEIECVAVKRATCRNQALLYDAEESRKKIHDAAERTVRAIAEGKKFAPYKPILPAEVVLEFCRADYCEASMEKCPKAERLDARTLRAVIKSGLGWRLGKDDIE